MFLHFYDFEPRIIPRLFSNTKSITVFENLRNIFQSLLMFYYIIKTKQEFIFCIDSAKALLNESRV